MEEKKKEEKALEWKKITSSLPRRAGQTLAERRCNLSPGGFLFFSRRQQLETQISHPLTVGDKRRDETRRDETEDQQNGRPIRAASIEEKKAEGKKREEKEGQNSKRRSRWRRGSRRRQTGCGGVRRVGGGTA